MNNATTPIVKRILMTVALVVAPLSLAMGQTTNEKPKSKGRTKDEEAVRKVVTDSVEAWNRHDVKAFSMLFTDDADFINVLGAGAAGRTEIEKLHAPLFSTIFKESKVTTVDTRVRFIKSDVATVDSTWGMTGYIDPADEKRTPRKALMIMNLIMTKKKGKWYVAVMHKWT